MPSNVMDAAATMAVPPPTRPLTGAEYLESLRDGREIWIYGERVEDVTTHPAFRNTARWLPACMMPCTIRRCRQRSPLPRTPVQVGIPTATSGPHIPGKSNSQRATRSPPGRA